MKRGGKLRQMKQLPCKRLLALLLVMLAICVSGSWQLAYAGDAPPDADKTLATARKSLDAVQAALASDKKSDASALSSLRATALDVQTQADAIAESLTPQLASVQARLTELGDVPEGATEAPNVAAQRAQLQKSRTALDSQVKLARLLSVEAGQSVDAASSQRRSQFQAQLGERTSSILGSSYWSEVRSDYPRDASRLADLGGDFVVAFKSMGPSIWAGMALAAIALIALRMWAAHRLMKITATRVPSGRLRRSFHALTIVVLGLAIPGLLAEVFHIGLTWSGDMTDDLQAIVGGTVAMILFGGYISGLGNALLSPQRTSWRLPPISDLVAKRLRALPIMLALAIGMVWLTERLASQINASLSVTVAINCLIVATLGGIMAWGLFRLSRARREAAADPDAQDPTPRPLWVSAMVVISWTVLLTAGVCVLTGYVAFGSFIVKQLSWTLVVLSSLYLFAVLAEDTFTTLLVAPKANNDDTQPELAQPLLREQAAVLLSGVTRLLLALLALLLLAAPFGAGPLEMFQRMDQLRGGVAIGEVNIQPARVAQALLVLALTLFGVRVFKSWLSRRYLPTTQLDPGMQSSASTLFGYTGIVVAVSLALSAVGIGLERIAWVASALSVGIGFGLQAVVQNFVSGLILLAERPVKVGDWVSLGGIEGDILRVNVRATEIQMSDRSTVIVPNSEFITKTVRNVTHANPLGVVTIKLPMPLITDADQVRSLILEAFKAHPGVLENPSPNVFLDGIDASGNLMFNATAYVSSPRAAYGVRSAILYDMLTRLREARMDMYRPPAMILHGAAPSASDGDEAARPGSGKRQDDQPPPISAAQPPEDSSAAPSGKPPGAPA